MNARKFAALFIVLLVGLAVLAGCGKKEAEQPSASQPAQPAAPAGGGTKVDSATTGSLSGVVKFEGTAPKPAKIDMSQDPACKGSNAAETIVADGGKLANAFVYVKDGAEKYSFDVPKEKAVIDQQGCRYHPHVLGVMVGQTVEIRNDDPTTHNIHPTPKENREWNESQPPKGAPLEKTFARQEIMLPVKCNQHPWMKMYVNIVKTPLFAVTDKDGKYEIKGLPPGDYTIAVVHEKLGEQTQKVTVGAKESKTADFSYKGGAAGATP